MTLSTGTFYIWSGLWGYPVTYRVIGKPYKGGGGGGGGGGDLQQCIHIAVLFSTDVGWQYHIADTVCFFYSKSLPLNLIRFRILRNNDVMSVKTHAKS